MSNTYPYNLANLSQDHPALYRRELEVWADCFAVRTGAVAGATVDVELRARVTRPAGRATRDTLSAAIAPHSVAPALQNLIGTIPVNGVTERGALAAAAAGAAVFNLRFREVTMRGECGDYWMEDQAGRPNGELCEMSGIGNGQRKSLYSLFQQKRTQVLGNALAVACYVSVTKFGANESYFCRVR